MASDGLNSSSGTDLLCFSHLRWNFVTQRPQHLLTQAAQHRRVFYWEEPVWHAEVSLEEQTKSGSFLEVRHEATSVWIVTPHLCHGSDSNIEQRTLLNTFIEQNHVSQFVSWYYTPMSLAFSRDLHADAVVYDCMDQLSHFQDAPKDLVEREKELLGLADVVFTGGLSLFEEKRDQHSNVHLFPSSVDVAHFALAKTMLGADAADQAAISEPRIGFYGVLDERFDLQLLQTLASLRPNLHFVILGPIAKINPESLPISSNIHYLGSKRYEDLPIYLSGWGVAILPFAMNASTLFISPTKTPEYLAAGCPVVSTPVRDVVREYGEKGLVQIAATAEDFAVALDRALEPPLDAWKLAVEQKLATTSWESTWCAMSHLLDSALIKRKLQGTPSGERISQKAEMSSAARAIPRDVAVSASDRGPKRKHSDGRSEHFDYLIAGAGFAGSVLAERLATQLGKRVLIVDKRDHIAGNAYDTYNADGVLIHRYGPHIFHTNSDDVVAYLSQFTSWRFYEHRVLSSIDGRLLPIPINLDTINRLYDLQLDEAGMKVFLAQRAVHTGAIKTSEDIVVSRVGRELYEKFFRNYTRKQWGLDPSQLDAAVAGRIPVRFDRDDRYFTDTFQAMPLHGYTKMFEAMLDQQTIQVKLGAEFADVVASYPNAKVIYTGPIDEYFGFRFGPLPYRSLEFRHETLTQEVFQEAPVINYPNEHEFTRVTEFKYLTGQKHPKTSIVYEYPRSSGDPYYPIPRPENQALFTRYRELADKASNVTFCGRLANYKYFNMDQVVAQALKTFRTLSSEEKPAIVGLPLAAKVPIEQGQA